MKVNLTNISVLASCFTALIRLGKRSTWEIVTLNLYICAADYFCRLVESGNLTGNLEHSLQLFKDLLKKLNY